MLVRRAPETLDGGDEAGRLGELAPARAVGANEIGVAEAADRGRAVLLAPCPQIAPGNAPDHPTAPALHTLTLERPAHFLDGIGHRPSPQGTDAYTVGSCNPAPPKPWARRHQLPTTPPRQKT